MQILVILQSYFTQTPSTQPTTSSRDTMSEATTRAYDTDRKISSDNVTLSTDAATKSEG
jgi:hypothetical protein